MGDYKKSSRLDKRSLPTESQIKERWASEDEPLIDIVCITYNHADFIEECLCGFLIQVTDFPFRINIYDDASTDGTADILKKYKADYPDLIALNLQSENQRSKGLKLFSDVVNLPGLARYVARCEGDDYWTDREKLQKQVEFLEANPDYVLVTHDVQAIHEDGSMHSTEHLPVFYKRDFSAMDLALGWAGPVTQSMLFRNVLGVLPPEFRLAPNGDIFLATLLGKHGNSGYVGTIEASMYRLHDGGVFSPQSGSDKFDTQALTFFWIYKYFKRVGDEKLATAFKLKFLEKQLREVSFREWFALGGIRFLGGNVRKWINYLLR